MQLCSAYMKKTYREIGRGAVCGICMAACPVGAAGISAFPMSARVVQKMGLQANNQNHLLMFAVGANVSGQIASVIAGGVILGLVPTLI